MHQRSPRQAVAVLIRAAAFGVALGGLYLLMRVMGEGVGTVAVGGLLAMAVLWGGTLVWSASDARRSPTVAPVIVRWAAVATLMIIGYLTAALLASGSYGSSQSLASVVALALVLGSVVFVLPAALGIAGGVALRPRSADGVTSSTTPRTPRT